MTRQKSEGIFSIVMGVALTATSFFCYFGGVRFTTGAWGLGRAVGGSGSPIVLLLPGLWFLAYGFFGLRRKYKDKNSD
jgi:hypothetical protein